MDSKDKKPLAAILVAEKAPKPEGEEEMGDMEAVKDEMAAEMMAAVAEGDKDKFKLALEDFLAACDY